MRTFLFLKFILVILFSILISNYSFSQQGEWTWIHGSMAGGSTGTYGVQGVPSPSNEPPGVYETTEWTDPNGNFWIFSGYTAVNFYNDLWKYDPVINQWTWVKGPGVVNNSGSYGVLGVSSPFNNPPFRACNIGWTDNQGNLWLFGGYSGYSDLWKYDVTTNEWTWMHGPNTTGNPGVYGVQGIPSTLNNPGGRWETAAAWTDANGDLWMYGGGGSGEFSDLWRYHIATDEWTWMHGSQSLNAPAVYGTLGVEDPLNMPGTRRTYSRWKDLSGNLWLFGGFTVAGVLNDLWRYNPLTNSWTWISGSNTPASPGHFGVKCQSDSLNIPNARWENRTSWTDNNGNFWLFGGGTNSGIVGQNDLWKYCVSQNKWTWISGDSTTGPVGNWGTIGVSSPLNKPDGRFGSVGGKDNNGNLYMFGGYNASTSPCNDLWRFVIDPNCAPCNTTPVAIFNSDNHICPGTCTDFQNLSVNAISYLWSFPGANPPSSTDVNPTNICYTTPGTYDVELIAYGSTSNDTLLLANFITVYPTPSPQGIQQSGDTLFANPGAVTYQWYENGVLIPGATDYFYVATESGNYNVVATDVNDCEVEAVIFDVAAAVTPLSRGEGLGVRLYPNPVSEELTVSGFQLNEIAGVTICNLFGEKIIADVNKTSNGLLKVDCNSLASGIYFLEISTAEKIHRAQFVKQ